MKSSLGARKTVRYELNTNAYDRYEMADFHLKIIYIDIFSWNLIGTVYIQYIIQEPYRIPYMMK